MAPPAGPSLSCAGYTLPGRMRHMTSRTPRSLRFLQSLSAILFITIVVVTFGQVVLRYVFKSPVFWAEEVARYAFIWMSFIGAAVAIALDAHANISFVLNALPHKARKVVQAIGRVLSIAFFAVVGYSALRIAVSAASDRSPALGLPMSAVYLALPFASVFAVAYLVISMWQELRQDKQSNER